MEKFIYLFNKLNNKQTKITFPKNLIELIRISKKIFGFNSNIIIFKDEKGNQIDLLEKIYPGMIIYVESRTIKQINQNDKLESYSTIPNIKFENIINVTNGIEIEESPSITHPIKINELEPPKVLELKKKNLKQFEDNNNSQIFNNSNKSFYFPLSQIYSNLPLSIINSSAVSEMYSKNSHELITIEIEQKKNWYNSIIKELQNYSNFKNISNIYYDNYCKDIINEYRFISNGEFLYNFHLIITGPKKSGKTILLSKLIDFFLIDFLISNYWKSTFVFIINIKEFLLYFDNYKDFFNFYINLTIQQLINQNPKLKIELLNFYKKIIQIFDYNIKKFNESFTDKYISLINMYIDLLNDLNNIEKWIENIILFPYYLGKLIGFKNFLFIIDDIEFGDIIHQPLYPFKSNNNNIMIINKIQLLLSKGNSIITLTNLDFNYLFFFPENKIIPTYNIQKNQSKQNFKYLIECLQNKEKIELSIDLLNGIPNFFNFWDKLNFEMDLFLSFSSKEEIKDKSYLKALIIAQNLINLIFETEIELTIESIQRIE